MEFATPSTQLERISNVAGLAEIFEPRTDMEKEMASLLKRAGAIEDEDVQRKEEALAMKVGPLCAEKSEICIIE